MFQFTQSETNGVRRRIFFYAAAASDGYTPVTTGLSVSTLVQVTKNGVTPAITVLNPAFTHISNGLWFHELTQALLDTVGVITVTISDAVMRPVQAVGYVYSGDPLTSSTAPTVSDIWSHTTRSLTAGAITSSTFGNSAINLRLANDPIVSNARFTTFDSFAGYPLLSTTANHQVAVNTQNHVAANVHQFQNNTITSNATDTTFVEELVDAVWDELLSTHSTSGSAGKILRDLASVYTGVTGLVTSAVVATFNSFSTNLTASNETYDEQTIVFTTGNCAGQSVPVTEYLQTNGFITTEDPLTSEPQPGDAFSIIPIHVHKRTQIADALLSRLLDSSGSSNDVMNERTVRSALRAMRNRVIVNSGTMSVYKEDDQTAAWEGTLSNTADVTVNPDGGIE